MGGGIYLYTNNQASITPTSPVTEESEEMTVADTKDTMKETAPVD